MKRLLWNILYPSRAWARCLTFPVLPLHHSIGVEATVCGVVELVALNPQNLNFDFSFGRLRENTKMILLISALILNVVKNIKREILNEVNQENQWIPETQATRGKDQLRKQRQNTL